MKKSVLFFDIDGTLLSEKTGKIPESAVQALQERLVELGYLDDTADGIFGGNTANAIRAAQEQAGMESTGVADNEFQQFIFSSAAQPAA